MQIWAKGFYQSTAWRKCREAYIAYVHGLCERCQSPGYIVHHKVWLTPNNINDPNVSLNHMHLEYLCIECHNRTHSKHIEGMTRDGLMFNEFGDLVEIK
jgi:5-methylcytosine-specific restriction enzyme A